MQNKTFSVSVPLGWLIIKILVGKITHQDVAMAKGIVARGLSNLECILAIAGAAPNAALTSVRIVAFEFMRSDIERKLNEIWENLS